MNFSITVFKLNDDFTYALGFDEPPDSVDLRIVIWVQGPVIYVEFKSENIRVRTP